MTPLPPHRLDYTPPPPLVRRARFERWAIRGVIALLVLSSIAWGPNLWNNIRAAHWERRCMTHTAPADAVVYEADLAGAGRILVQRTVPEWDAYYGFIKYTHSPKSGRAVLFLHARQTRNEEPQLVVVEHGPISTEFGDVRFDAATPHAGTPSDPPEVRSGYNAMRLPGLKGATHLRFYAGQPDTNDPSHFTIAYETDDRKGTIDGRLLPKGRVELRPVSGPPTSPPSDD